MAQNIETISEDGYPGMEEFPDDWTPEEIWYGIIGREGDRDLILPLRDRIDMDALFYQLGFKD